MNRKYRKTIIAGNWKMNMLASEIKAYAAALKSVSASAKWCETVVCVPAPLIPGAVKAFRDCRVTVGAQNMSEHAVGAYTGEISGAQLRDVGAACVIVGHSERRAIFGETDTVINKKVLAALENGLKPIICVGETEEQRALDITESLITLQVKAALSGVSAAQMRRVIIAYEPVWAIGTGKTATPDDAGEVAKLIRAVVRKMYGARVARGVSILYGGSMSSDNAYGILAQPDIDGGLIGTASLEPESFAAIIKAANQ